MKKLLLLSALLFGAIQTQTISISGLFTSASQMMSQVDVKVEQFSESLVGKCAVATIFGLGAAYFAHKFINSVEKKINDVIDDANGLLMQHQLQLQIEVLNNNSIMMQKIFLVLPSFIG